MTDSESKCIVEEQKFSILESSTSKQIFKKTHRSKKKLPGRKQRLKKKLEFHKQQSELVKKQLRLSRAVCTVSSATKAKGETKFIHPSSILSGSTKTCTSVNHFKNSHYYTIPSSIRSICYEDLRFTKEDLLGKGTFGKCIRGKLAHLNVCIKVLRKGTEYQATFSTEATLLSYCCHPNLPWIYGVVHQPSIIVLSLHTIDHKCFTIHSILQGGIIAMPVDQWKTIVYGVILAIEYLHNKSILHNDIKGNNVVIEKAGCEARSILIDLGKGCFLPHGKAYNLLNDAKRREHKKKYPHIAPDLIDGHCSQSKNSDIYSFGKLVKQINDIHLNLPALQALYLHCNEYYCNQRPSTVDVKATITNLFY